MCNERLVKTSPKHPVTIKLDKLNAKIIKLQGEAKDIQDKCPHEWKITNQFNDGDGWSVMIISYYNDMKCDICGLQKTVKTGEGRQYC